MDVSELRITAHGLSQAIAGVDLSAADRPLCSHYYAMLFGKAMDAHPELREPLQFLAIVCGWLLRPDFAESPFAPAIVSENPRTPSWQDVSDVQVGVVAGIARGVGDSELRARLCDLVWLRTRNHEDARLAAEEYVRSASRLIAMDCFIGEKERLNRAVQLAAQIGRNDGFHSQILNRIIDIAETADIHHCSLANCLEVLLNSKSDMALKLHDLATARASTIETANSNPRWERRFWELASGFARIAKDADLNTAALRKVAETFEREAENASMQAVAAQFWHGALQTYRRIAAQDDASRVHRRMLDAQSQIKSEMLPIDAGSVDLTQIAAEARALIFPDSKPRSIAHLVFATQWLEKADISEKAKAMMSDYPLHHMFASVRFTGTGKTAASAPGVGPSASEIPEDRLTAEMCQQYRYFVPIVANGRIEAMRHELNRRHNVSQDDVARFVYYSPFVPVGREPLFVIGLHAGLHGRFVEAIHVLLPQVENAIRCILVESGAIASSVRADGIQQEFDLNRVLVMPETESILGEDLTFALRVLLTERFGYNLRNEMAHGMVEYGAFFADAAVFTWWLILRVVAGPAANTVLESTSS